MAEIRLNRPRVGSLVGQIESAGMAELMRVDMQANAGGHAGALDDPGEHIDRQRLSPFAYEHMARGGAVAFLVQRAQGAQFDALQRVGAREPVLEPGDVDGFRSPVDILPFETDCFAGAEPVIVRHHHKRPVAYAIAPGFAGGIDQSGRLAGCEMLSLDRVRPGGLGGLGLSCGHDMTPIACDRIAAPQHHLEGAASVAAPQHHLDGAASPVRKQAGQCARLASEWRRLSCQRIGNGSRLNHARAIVFAYRFVDQENKSLLILSFTPAD